MRDTIWKALTVVTALWLAVLTSHVTMRESGQEGVTTSRTDDGVHVSVRDPSASTPLGVWVRVEGDRHASLTVAQDPCGVQLRAEPADSNGASMILRNGKARIVAGFEDGSPVVVGYGPDGKELWRQPQPR